MQLFSVCWPPHLCVCAVSISGYIPTSGDITVCTIETFDLENMGIAVGIFFIGATELEIHPGGGVISPLPVGHPKV